MLHPRQLPPVLWINIFSDDKSIPKSYPKHCIRKVRGSIGGD